MEPAAGLSATTDPTTPSVAPDARPPVVIVVCALTFMPPVESEETSSSSGSSADFASSSAGESSSDSAGLSGDSSADSDADAEEPDVESDGSAHATPGVFATAAPIPKATAKAPTRPMHFALLMAVPLDDSEGTMALGRVPSSESSVISGRTSSVARYFNLAHFPRGTT